MKSHEMCNNSEILCNESDAFLVNHTFNCNMCTCDLPENMNCTITVDEIARAIVEMPFNKSPGIGGIVNEK